MHHHNHLTAGNHRQHTLKNVQTDQSTGVPTNFAMTVVIDPVYVQLFLRSATRFIPNALFHTLYSARFIPSKAVSLVVTVFGESNEPCSTSLSLCVPGSRLTDDPCAIRLIFLCYFIFYHIVYSHGVLGHRRLSKKNV